MNALCDHPVDGWEWRDCDKKGHEVECYVASCGVEDCDWEQYDCEEEK